MIEGLSVRVQVMPCWASEMRGNMAREEKLPEKLLVCLQGFKAVKKPGGFSSLCSGTMTGQAGLQGQRQGRDEPIAYQP